MSHLKAYLAENYMSGPKADAILSRTSKPKKKKRKVDSEITPGTAMIRDEDGGWGEQNNEDNEDLSEAVIEKDRGFKKRKVAQMEAGSSWVTLQEGTEAAIKEESPPPAADEQPQLVETPFVGGLVSAAQLKKVLPQHHTAKSEDLTVDEIARAQETVYRDATGKKIDTKAARAEAARLKREREEKEAQKMEWGKGLVQREEQEQRRLELERQRGKAFARHADDKDLNEELKAKELWNDPAAAFLTKKKVKGPRKPQYSGPPPPPNRFGIKPGYRWDGVDRGNGFEKKVFQSANAKKRLGAESYQWSAEDM
ncbi:hypothetical protein K443DRAFT_680985 [Laccaria amethystina LaAM-08-1]|uniref:Pre-mRNA-splicing factor CWC26 n=1 Tax=Laccaria amethystina LaAM-08-1 TaxID=1095629 RepID=A0A0C9XKJ1_9AGAR|nr:hypothetical protein K443DRAFT_680985 [Laccaria amethystina LaAM-08-1]